MEDNNKENNNMPPVAGETTPSAPATNPVSATSGAVPESTNTSTPSTSGVDPTESSSKVGLWIALGVGLLLAVGAIVSVIVPQMLTPDYSKMYDSSIELQDALSEYFYSSACHDVALYVDDYYSTDAEEYNESIEDCKKDATKVYNAVSKFEAESGASRDSQINGLYQNFKKAFDEKAPAQDKLESTLKVYAAAHDFVVGMNDFDTSSGTIPTVEEFKKVTDTLVNSGDATLKEFGEGLNTRYAKLYDAAQAYIKTSYSDPNYREVSENYEDATDNMEDYLEEQLENIKNLGYPLADVSDYDDYDDDDDDDNDGVNPVDAFDEVQEAIYEKLK